MNLNYTIMSKRKLLRIKLKRALWMDGTTSDADIERVETSYTLREHTRILRQGRGGETNNVIDVGLLEFALRDHLNATATRVACCGR